MEPILDIGWFWYKNVAFEEYNIGILDLNVFTLSCILYSSGYLLEIFAYVKEKGEDIMKCPKCGNEIGKTEYLFIPWCKIECIGEDTILVRLTPNEEEALTSPICHDGCEGKKR